jgi:hypothetical protein
MSSFAERLRLDPRTAALCGFTALLFIAHSVYLACVTEDAFITFRYAQNFFAGNGFVWNVGEAPVEGYTNFLWLLISTGVLAIGADLPAASQWLGVVASIAVMAFVYDFGRLLGWTSRFAVVPCLALACSGPFATWATSGMETNFFTCWIVGAAYFCARFLTTFGARDAWLSSGCLLLASLTRPEGVMIAGIVGGAMLLAGANHSGTSKQGSGTAIAKSLVPLAAYAVLVAIYIAWRWSYFGYPLPNTFYAKTGGGVAQAIRGTQYAGLFALHFVFPWTFAIGLGLWARGRTQASDAPRGLTLLCAAIVMVYTGYICAVGGDYMAMYRFFVPVLPFIYLLTGVALERASRATAASSGTLVKAALFLGLLGTGFHSTPIESAWVAKPELMHGNYRGVELERWYVNRHRVIGEFFAHYGKPGESLATGAIGAVAYYSELSVQDVHGITDSHIAHNGRAQGDSLGTGLPGHEKADYPYVFDKKPTFYMFSRKLRESPLPGIPQLVPEVDALVAREYKVGSVRLVDKVNGQSGYFSFLERRDRNTIAR